MASTAQNFLLKTPQRVSITVAANLTNEGLKKLLYWYGPVYVGVDETATGLNLSKGGQANSVSPIVQPKISNTASHAMLLMGYGNDNRGGGYWLFKNSWGSDAGYKGFYGVQMTEEGPGSFMKDINYVCNHDLLDLDETVYRQERDNTNEVDYDAYVRSRETDAQAPLTYGQPLGIPAYSGNKPLTPAEIERLRDRITFSETGDEALPEIPEPRFREKMFYTTTENRFGSVINGMTFSQGFCPDCWLVVGTDMLACALAIKYRSQNPNEAHFVSVSPDYFASVWFNSAPSGGGAYSISGEACKPNTILTFMDIVNGAPPTKAPVGVLSVNAFTLRNIPPPLGLGDVDNLQEMCGSPLPSPNNGVGPIAPPFNPPIGPLPNTPNGPFPPNTPIGPSKATPSPVIFTKKSHKPNKTGLYVGIAIGSVLGAILLALLLWYLLRAQPTRKRRV